MNLRTVRKLFARSPKTHRPVSLFLWNDRADPEGLASEMDSLLTGGMGGVLLHRGAGLPPESYLDERWFEGVGAITRRARRGRDSAWIYEDLEAPTAAGQIAELLLAHPEFVQSRLCMRDFVANEDYSGGNLPGDSVAAFMVTHEDTLRGVVRNAGGGVSLVPEPIEVRPIVFDTDPRDWPGRRFLVFRVEHLPGSLNFFNAAAIRAFLDETHEKYRTNLKRYFGNTLGLCFLGGAQFSMQAASLPWDPELPALFRETRDYPLIDRLPSLFFDSEGCKLVRYDFWTLVAEMFREGTAHPFGEWCAQRRIPSSGHYAGAGCLARSVGSTGPLLPLYEHQQFPGVDLPEVDDYDTSAGRESFLRHLVAIKEAASVNRQLGKGGVINESIQPGDSRQRVESLRRLAHIHMALGLNFITHHATRVSLRGDRKHDSMPIVGPRQPYWPHITKHLNALSRVAWLLGQGKALCEVLVLHPSSSLQAEYRHPRSASEEEAMRRPSIGGMVFEVIEKHFSLFSAALIDAQIDFDYGDEELLARHAHAERQLLVVGEQSYRIVVVPPSTNLRSSTLQLLHDFAMGGGIVVTVGTIPLRLDGRPSDAFSEFVEEYAERVLDGVDLFDYAEVVQRLSDFGARTVTLYGEDGASLPALMVQRRQWEDIEIFFIANASNRSQRATVEFEPGPERHVEAWDPDSGVMTRLSGPESEGPLPLLLEWQPGQGRLFLVLAGEDKNVERAVVYGEEFRRLEVEWYGERCEANVLPLFECRVAGENTSAEWGAVDAARAVLGPLLDESNEAVWFTTEWRFRLAGDDAATEGCSVAIELGTDSALALNGEALDTDGTDWMLDPAIVKVSLPALRAGENVLELRRACTSIEDVQAPWVVGPFRVGGNGVDGWIIGRAEPQLGLGEWGEMGMPFYVGRVVYRAEIQGYELYGGDRAMLVLPGLLGTAEVRVNGKVVDHVLWAPHEVDITEYWQPGELKIEVEVAGTLSNLLEAVNPKKGDGIESDRERFGLLRPPYIAMASPIPIEAESAPEE